eukprot:CAMPEP_0118654594 /NCGR_PEP_ID=MMETSP0785-20121206/12476_1 /TAXON_ID=91992 /ORGANISM="Bolidomonas pacifica, Strain CCMP 1866" /LENGTH=58 /DNA_ID=CAMNT_0006547271 /DNA_START=705 /DNA_END=881 /DNA_ORIENTATION=+
MTSSSPTTPIMDTIRRGTNAIDVKGIPNHDPMIDNGNSIKPKERHWTYLVKALSAMSR